MIIYKGKKYKILKLIITYKKDKVNKMAVEVAPQSLADAMGDKIYDVPSEEEQIDEFIYHYVPDEVIEKGDLKDIAENHLDVKFKFEGNDKRDKVIKRLKTMDEGDMSYLAEKLADDYCEQLYWDSLRVIFEDRFLEDV